MRPSSGDGADLLERTEESARLVALLEQACGGTGAVAIVAGPGGIGKSRLLDHIDRIAIDRGIAVARARGTSLEQDFPYGGVRQLLDPLVGAIGDPERAFEGAARAGLAVVGEGSAPPEGGAGTILHGLYWLTAALAEPGPLVLLCDDAHWLDGPMLSYLAYLGHRIAELPCLLVVGTRPPGSGPEGAVLEQMMTEHRAHIVWPGPLSLGGVRQLVHNELAPSADDEFCAAVAQASGGNPFLVVELLRAARSSDIALDATGMQHLADLSAGSIVAARLGRLPAAARELARSVAVLAGDAHLRHVAELTSMSVPEASTLTDELIRAEVLAPPRPLSFVHPLVAAAVYSELLPGNRAARHRRAAELLSAEGSSPEKVGTHLLMTDGTGDRWACNMLVEAARSSAARGATDAAIAFYRRALEEPPEPDGRLDLLLELGTAEALVTDAEAAIHLKEARDGLLAVPDASVPLTIAYGVALALAGEHAAALDAFDELEPLLEGRPDLAHDALAGSVIIGMTERSAARLAVTRVARLRASDVSAASPLVRGVRSFTGALGNEPSDAMSRLAADALAVSPPDDLSRWMWLHLPLAVLVMTDQVDEAAARIDEGLALARALGAPVHTAVTLTVRSWLALRTGDIADAEADALDAIEALRPRRRNIILPGPLGLLTDVARHRGDLAGAEATLEEWGYAAGEAGTFFNLFLLRARGLLRLDQGRVDDAIADLEAGQRHFADLGGTSPALHAWGAHLASALARSPGGRPRALAEARQAVALAEAFGAPRALASALLALAELDDPQSIGLLERSAALFEQAGDRLGHARALVSLGRLLRCEGDAKLAVTVLGEALDLADRCGATAVVAAAREQLVAAGSRPRRNRVAGIEALTPSERRVATVAAGGHTNREVAQELFLSIKTVETHLAHVFQKLGISSRAELAGALHPVPGAAR